MAVPWPTDWWEQEQGTNAKNGMQNKIHNQMIVRLTTKA
jgi:hypothetical protein